MMRIRTHFLSSSLSSLSLTYRFLTQPVIGERRAGETKKKMSVDWRNRPRYIDIVIFRTFLPVDPSLLLLDEPTSGLDSTSANRLLQQILQGVARAGRTIITTIHQPSSRMFHMFDKVLLISEGYPMYYGNARGSMEYFSSPRFVPEIAMNPTKFLLDLATGQVNDIRVPEDLHAPQDTAECERVVIKYLQLKYKTELEPKEKEENHRTGEAAEHLCLAVQIKKDWTITWWTGEIDPDI